MPTNMTGLTRWAMDHDTTADEVQALAMSENQDSWEQVLGPARTTEEPVPAGRGTAFEGMLERGRAGGIRVPVATVAFVADMPIQGVKDVLEDLADAVASEDAKLALMDGGAETFRSDMLPFVLEACAAAKGTDNVGEAKGLVVAVAGKIVPAPKAQPKVEEKAKAAKKPSRRGKYSVGKAALEAMLKPDGDEMPIREIRAFLLSVPGTKPADVAVMSDPDVAALFDREYASVQLGSGTIILPMESYKSLVACLADGGACYVPKAEARQ